MIQLLVKTERGAEILLEWVPEDFSGDQGHFKVRDTTEQTFKQLVLGKKVKQPKLEMPLIIYLNSTEHLETSRIKEIKTI